MTLSTSSGHSAETALLGHCPVGANPIIWSNDDFPELAGDVPLDTILAEMRAAGFAGTELGHAYPREAAQLGPILTRHGLLLASGWHSTHLGSCDLATEESAFRAHVTLLKALGARVAIVAECTRCIHGTRDAALGFGATARPRLSDAEWRRFVAGLQHLVNLAAGDEMAVVYHHHIGTVIQREADLDRLMASVNGLQLVLDPGHLAFAGIDPAGVATRYASRIAHVHLKSVRPHIVDRARQEGWSFCRAVTEGVFTIPGDGSVDFPALFRILADAGYRGWLVVEAEENPATVPALAKAQTARAYVRQHAGA